LKYHHITCPTASQASISNHRKRRATKRPHKQARSTRPECIL